MPSEDALVFPQQLPRGIEALLVSELPAIRAAARLLAASLRDGGVIQAFGTGHSRAVTLELCGRAGGLVPAGMLAIKDLVFFGGVPPEEILDPRFEREPGLARRIYELAAPGDEDAFVIVSNSGVNASVVEMARLAQDNGHVVVAITSRSHTRAVPSRDATGQRLADLADVVIDNHAPVGDATVEVGPARVGAVSTIHGCIIAQVLTEAICRHLVESGEAPPIYLSANLPEGDAHNDVLTARYAARVRPIEP